MCGSVALIKQLAEGLVDQQNLLNETNVSRFYAVALTFSLFLSFILLRSALSLSLTVKDSSGEY